jgi:hypothetical protein
MQIIIVPICIILYFWGVAALEKSPTIGHIMTVPARIMWIVLCSTAWPGMHGILMGCGLALLMSFERNRLWMIGLILIIVAQLWPCVA